jgi:hypothetical protein
LSKKEDVERKAKGFAMNATGRLVLDSSIALAWCFADEKNVLKAAATTAGVAFYQVSKP